VFVQQTGKKLSFLNLWLPNDPVDFEKSRVKYHQNTHNSGQICILFDAQSVKDVTNAMETRLLGHSRFGVRGTFIYDDLSNREYSTPTRYCSTDTEWQRESNNQQCCHQIPQAASLHVEECRCGSSL
jgi:hypothetical protein